MKFNWQVITFLASLTLAVIFGALITVWNSFVIFMGFALLYCSIIFTIYRLKMHKQLKNKIAEQRYCDAYIYADENGLQFNVNNFQYDKSTERALRNRINNSLIMVLLGFSFCVLSIFLIVMGCINA